jgi:hypothetical protein
MCDNCSMYSVDNAPREFKFEDIAPTLMRHEPGVDPYTFGWYRSFLMRHDETKSTADPIRYVRDKMRFERGYLTPEIDKCENFYKKGLKVLELFKQKGIKHQPRKKR